MTDVAVRETTTADVPGVRRVARRSWTAAYDFLAGRTVERAMAEWYAPAALREQIAREGVVHFVAETTEDETAGDLRIVGYAGGRVEGSTGRVGAIYVDPDRWGEGIGTRLFERLLDALDGRGAERADISILAANGAGRSFYESRGFEVVEERETDLFGETVTQATYAREL